MSSRLAVVIPAYRPSAGLIDLLGALQDSGLPIVVVDDGSGPEFASTFARAAAFPNVQLLRHAVNLGKGAALKTAFNHLLCSVPDLVGVVTADADGQHDPEDILGVAAELAKHPNALVLGARMFGEDVPLRSRFGNVLTRGIMHALLGRRITDTQTGLRGIPASLLPRLLRLEATGYEFALEMLLAAHHLSMPVVERPIRTIYEPGNKSSHFNPIIDSMKIYFVLLRFGSVSLLTALLDNLVFILSVHRLGSVLASQVLGRFFAVIFNYWMVRSSVFYSRQRHKTVLPKYLGLVVASGTCSYLGIQFLAKRFGVPVVAAKLLVETVLFFVNFAVQRLFIFQPDGAAGTKPAGEPAPRAPLHPFAIALGAGFVALVGLELYGFRVSNLFAQEIWSPIGLKRFERYSEIYAVLAGLLMLAAPRWFGVAVAGLLAVLTAISVGPMALLAAAFFLLSCSALGGRLLGRRAKEHAAQDELCGLALGAAVYIFLMTWLARLPVNYPAVWGGVLVVPVLADLGGVRRRLAWLREALIPKRAPSAATRAALALLVWILTAHWFVALKPETSADGLAMHLAIPMDIAAHHALTFQPARFLWAVMPMGADYAYSISYLLGGEYAARLLDFAMLLVIVGLLYDAARRWLSPAAACLLAASFAATPMVQLVTGSLFVENVLAALILAMMAAIWRLGETGGRRWLYAAAALGGAAISCKFGALAFVAVALPFALAGRAPKLHKAAAVAVLLAAAAPPYAIAWSKTGNPLFPFVNQRFHSPLLPAGTEVKDYRFRERLTWWLPYAMTFRTNDYYEGQNGSLGFQYLVLVPLGIAGLALARNRVAVSAAVVALGAGLLVLNSEPNARYVYAAFPLVLLPIAAVMAWTAAHQRALYRALLAFLVVTTALDAYFLPASSYYHKDFCLRAPFSRAQRTLYLNEAAPVRNVIACFNREHASSAVLFTHEASIAGALGDVYENHWHQIRTWAKLREATTVPAMLQVMNAWNVRYLIAHKPEPGEEADPPVLAQLIAACTQPEYEAGNSYLARIDPACRPAALTDPPLAVEPGFYDDYDPAILFRGEWSKEPRVHGPDRDTTSHTDSPGAEIRFAFQGRELNYIHGMGPLYGIAAVTVDGTPQKPVDLYYKDLDWQHKETYCCFVSGRHLAVIRATGERNPASAGTRIDLDSFLVK